EAWAAAWRANRTPRPDDLTTEELERISLYLRLDHLDRLTRRLERWTDATTEARQYWALEVAPGLRSCVEWAWGMGVHRHWADGGAPPPRADRILEESRRPARIRQARVAARFTRGRKPGATDALTKHLAAILLREPKLSNDNEMAWAELQKAPAGCIIAAGHV